MIRRSASALLFASIISITTPGFGDDGLSVRLSTDRTTYFPGQVMYVSAEIADSHGLPATTIASTEITIEDPNEDRAARDQLVREIDGLWKYEFAFPADAPAGSWKIKVEVESSSRADADDDIEVRLESGAPDCLDTDGDGYSDAACGGGDCDDSDPTVFPGADERCGDGIDQDCRGGDLSCDGDDDGGGEASEEHAGLVWEGPGTCLQCHTEEAREVHGSVMYQWKGEAPDMVHGPSVQGKIAGGVNSYCINITGNWQGCGSCHIGLGALPENAASEEQLQNIDCLVCHQQAYRRVRVDGYFVPDTDSMTISMDQAVRTAHEPTRANCLQCHAKAGGGDAVKRGDLSLAHARTTDRGFDVHMATTGADLRCQACHTTEDHRVAGRGSDLRPTDLAEKVECTDCHDADEHDSRRLRAHTARVACQSCHIPRYAKDASDSSATEATETHRTWLDTASNVPPIHPASHKANDLRPAYRFWNHTNHNYLLGDRAEIDPATGRYPTSRPVGGIDDPQSKLYPFKYKTAEQPLVTGTSQLVALDTSVFFSTGDADAAARAGLENMGMSPAENIAWVETDTFQALNHEVGPSEDALNCGQCHGGGDRMDFSVLGYQLKGTEQTVCTQCHGRESSEGFYEIHEEHVSEENVDCSWCHGFSRPERSLRMPGSTIPADGNGDEDDEPKPRRSTGRRQ